MNFLVTEFVNITRDGPQLYILETKRLAVVALNLYRNLSVVFRVPPAVYVRLDAAAGRYFRDQDSTECGRFGYLFSRVYQFNNCGYVADYRIPNTFVLVGAVRTVC